MKRDLMSLEKRLYKKIRWQKQKTYLYDLLQLVIKKKKLVMPETFLALELLNQEKEGLQIEDEELLSLNLSCLKIEEIEKELLLMIKELNQLTKGK